MANPLVSISIITYNQAAYIAEAILSAVEQDYDPLEVVVADDGSTDGTADIVVEIGRKYISRVVPLTGGSNLGITGNSNRALRACRGEFVAFQGGDDVLLPTKIRKQVAWFAENPRAVLCAHEVDTFEASTGVIIRSTNPCPKRGVGAGRLISCGCPFGATAVMIRSTAIPAGGFDARVPVVSDWKFWIDCLRPGGEYGWIDEVLARYRRHELNLTTVSQLSASLHERTFGDVLTTIGLVEAGSPELLGDCRAGRGRVFRSEGIWHLQRGNTLAARRYFSQALLASFGGSAKLWAWYALTLAPQSVARRVLGQVEIGS